MALPIPVDLDWTASLDPSLDLLRLAPPPRPPPTNGLPETTSVGLLHLHSRHLLRPRRQPPSAPRPGTPPRRHPAWRKRRRGRPRRPSRNPALPGRTRPRPRPTRGTRGQGPRIQRHSPRKRHRGCWLLLRPTTQRRHRRTPPARPARFSLERGLPHRK